MSGDDDPHDLEEASGSAGGGTDWRAIGQYSVIGFVFPLAMVVGFLAGRWIGGWLGYPGAGSGVGLVVGIGAAFYNLYGVVRRMDREEGGGKPPAP